MFITVKFRAGTDIIDACEKACALARKLEIGVHFDFNDFPVYVMPYSLPLECAARYWRDIDRRAPARKK